MLLPTLAASCGDVGGATGAITGTETGSESDGAGADDDAGRTEGRNVRGWVVVFAGLVGNDNDTG